MKKINIKREIGPIPQLYPKFTKYAILENTIKINVIVQKVTAYNGFSLRICYN